MRVDENACTHDSKNSSLAYVDMTHLPSIMTASSSLRSVAASLYVVEPDDNVSGD